MKHVTQKIAVVVGVVINAEKKILIAQRPKGKHLSGLWEFPGGKIEPDEMPIAALQRELKEEVGLGIENVSPLIQVDYCYDEASVALDVYLIKQFSGTACGLEQQKIKWVSFFELADYPFPKANEVIINELAKYINQQ